MPFLKPLTTYYLLLTTYYRLRRVPFLKPLNDEQLSQLLTISSQKRYPRYSILQREGTRGAALIVVLEGEVFAQSSKLSGRGWDKGGPDGMVQSRGSSFGESGLVLPDLLRDMTVRAVSDCRVLIRGSHDACTRTCVAHAHALDALAEGCALCVLQDCSSSSATR